VFYHLLANPIEHESLVRELRAGGSNDADMSDLINNERL
jgi:hypothetical protein